MWYGFPRVPTNRVVGSHQILRGAYTLIPREVETQPLKQDLMDHR